MSRAMNADVRRSSASLLAALLAAALLLGGAGCAGDRHMGPRGGQAFDAIFTLQTTQRSPAAIDPEQMAAEEGEQAMTNVRLSTQRAAPGAPAAALQLQR